MDLFVGGWKGFGSITLSFWIRYFKLCYMVYRYSTQETLFGCMVSSSTSTSGGCRIAEEGNTSTLCYTPTPRC